MPIVRFRTSDGVGLEGRLTTPTEPTGGGVVVCHPHPQHGGSMESWMPPVLQRALVSDGWTGLRFNFRGVDGSGGTYGGGIDELLDVEAAVARVRDEVAATAPILVGGWSFGANVSLRFGLSRADVSGWFGVALPLGVDERPLPEIDRSALSTWSLPKLFIHGSRDDVAPLERAREVFEATAEPKRFHVVDGGNHYMPSRADEIAATLRTFAREVLTGAST